MGTNHVIQSELLNKNYTYSRLNQMHDDIEDEIQELNSHPSVDDRRIVMLKKKKLKISEQMFKIEQIN